MAQPAIDIPEPNSDDTDAVATALETAAIFGAQGDAREALRWVRRAAELAGDDGHDLRALNLARVAADLSTQVQSAPPPSDGQVRPAHQNALNETVRISSAPPASTPPQAAALPSVPQPTGGTGFAPVATSPRYTPLPTSAAAPPPGYGPQPSPGYAPQPTQPVYAQPGALQQPSPVYAQQAQPAEAQRQAEVPQYAGQPVHDASAPPPPPPPLPRPARQTQPFASAALPMTPDPIELPAAQGFTAPQQRESAPGLDVRPVSAPLEAPRPLDTSGRRLTPTATGPDSRRSAYAAGNPAGVQQGAVNAPPIEPQPALRIEAPRVVAPVDGGAEPAPKAVLRGIVAEPSTSDEAATEEPETDPNPKAFSALRQAARVAIMPYPGAAGLYVVQPLEDHQVPAEGTQEAVVILLGSNVNLFQR